jgi:hypothetical protein
MRIAQIISASAIFALAACGQAAAPSSADAQPSAQTSTAATSSTEATAAERTAILTALHLSADARGLVMNECNDTVTPSYIPADIGLGRTILFAMGGGPNGGYTCYGDGPDLHLMRADGAAWREVWANRGGYMVILPTTHNGAHDLLYGGPGMSHPWDRWDGSRYAPGGDMAESAMPADAVMLPQ